MDLGHTSDRSRGVALALVALPPLGIFGAHRFYAGKIASGILQAATFGGFGIWWMYDLIMVAAGSFRDAEGRRVVNWAESDTSRSRDQLSDDRMEMLLDEIDHLRAEVGDVVERVDFMERVISRVSDRGAIPPGST